MNRYVSTFIKSLFAMAQEKKIKAIVLVVLAWLLALALLYVVIIKIKIFFHS